MHQVTVWYDSQCPLCLREIALMRRLDRRGRIEFVAIEGLGDGACPVDRAELLARFHAREDGQLLSGAAAFAAMWRAIPTLRPFGLAARSPIVLALLERTYRAFLRVRPRIQRWRDASPHSDHFTCAATDDATGCARGRWGKGEDNVA